MDKSVRNYKLYVEKPDGTSKIVTMPFTIEFDIVRNIYSSVNAGSIRVINLNKDTREFIRHDEFDYGIRQHIKLEAGYGENLSTIYKGTISQAYSSRSGVNYITSISSEDGGWADSNMKDSPIYTATSQTKMKDIIEQLTATLAKAGISQGAIGKYLGETTRGNAYSGSVLNVLREVSGGGVFIDNEIVHVLKDNECLAGEVMLINSSSGLIGTPVRQKQFISFDMLLEPRVKIGQRIILDSRTLNEANNTDYKIIAITHKGVISESVSGSSITSITCVPGKFDPIEIITKSGEKITV